MSSSWSLLLPHPNPTRFSRSQSLTRSPSTNSASSSASSWSAIGIINMSSTFVSRRKSRQKKRSSAAPNSPPKLQPLIFSSEPIVDLTLPPYRARSEESLDALLNADSSNEKNSKYLRKGNEGRSSGVVLLISDPEDSIAHDDDNDAESAGLVSFHPRRGLGAGVDDDNNIQSHGLARSNLRNNHNHNQHHHHLHLPPPNSAPPIALSSSNFNSNHCHRSPEAFPSVPDIAITFPSLELDSTFVFVEQPGLSSRKASRSLTALDSPNHLTVSSEQPPLPSLPRHILMSSAGPLPSHVQSDCGHGTTTARTIRSTHNQDQPQRRASLFARTFSLRSSSSPRTKNRPPLQDVVEGITSAPNNAADNASGVFGTAKSNALSSSSNNGLQPDLHPTRPLVPPSESSDSGSGRASATSISLSDSACASSSSNTASGSGSAISSNSSMEHAPHSGPPPSLFNNPATKSGHAGHVMTVLMAFSDGHSQPADNHPTRPTLTPHTSSAASSDSHSNNSHSHEGEAKVRPLVRTRLLLRVLADLVGVRVRRLQVLSQDGGGGGRVGGTVG
ncbi:hypothetical protein CPB84DRAFT_1365302 [Gymnopilus junonius]|uniref:Uncharacterized protein n=1 Tax=Gymnopilus junonius TaxID=109634 RepID=A0A9P5P0K8_GYMJU|nr:hypothetical protein CPB84DRAFT_1365302 [Gymnopilus junonius]